MIYLILTSVIPSILLSIPLLNIILYPFAVLIQLFNLNSYALLVGIVFTIFIGFCQGYFSRERLINDSKKKYMFMPNIRIQVNWLGEAIYKSQFAYFVPHMYKFVPVWIFNTYERFEKMSITPQYTYFNSIIYKLYNLIINLPKQKTKTN